MYLPTIKSENVDVCFGGKHVLRGRVWEQSWSEKYLRQRGTSHASITCYVPTLLDFESPFTLPFAFLPWPTSPKKSMRWRFSSFETMLINVRCPNSIEISTRAADHFTRLYYSAYDSSTRVDDLPNFYRPNSAVSWNGNPYEGAQGMRDLISKMPKTQHEVQSFDCHPIPGGW